MDLPYGEMMQGFSQDEIELFHDLIRRMDDNMTRFAAKTNGEE